MNKFLLICKYNVLTLNLLDRYKADVTDFLKIRWNGNDEVEETLRRRAWRFVVRRNSRFSVYVGHQSTTVNASFTSKKNLPTSAHVPMEKIIFWSIDGCYCFRPGKSLFKTTRSFRQEEDEFVTLSTIETQYKTLGLGDV